MANSYLSRTFSGTPTMTTFTVSFWIKRSTIGATQRIISARVDGNNESTFYFSSSDQLNISSTVGGATKCDIKANRLFRDTNAWYHVVVQKNTTLATANDRVKIWVNGVEETDVTRSTTQVQNEEDFFLKSTATHEIGRRPSNNDQNFSGYFTHFCVVQGSVVAPTSFGETDSTSGIWKFKAPSGISFGTNGFHLKFENSGALGTDSSGNSQTWTTNGDLKQALDTPSNVYCTINPLHTLNSDTLLNGNTRFDGLSGSPYDSACGGTLGFNKGKWYWEFKWGLTGSGNQAAFVGIIDTEIPIVVGGNPSKGVTYRPDAGEVRKDGSNVSSSYSGSANDIFGMAFDMDAGTLKLHKNGTYFNSGNAVVTGIDLTKTYVPYIAPNGGTTQSNIYMNWGNGFFGTTAISSAGSNGNGSLFEYDVPSGYYALNTKNINTYG